MNLKVHTLLIIIIIIIMLVGVIINPCVGISLCRYNGVHYSQDWCEDRKQRDSGFTQRTCQEKDSCLCYSFRFFGKQNGLFTVHLTGVVYA